MNRQLFIEWFPQIMYNHHQTGPAGAVVFIPPFRDPFNYNFDPLVPLGIEMVGTAMHSRLVAEGKGGSAMRTGANYSTWWNGGLRTVTYFHNMIGILTEIIGNPTPMRYPAGRRQAVAAGRLAAADRAAGMALPPVDRVRDEPESRDSGLASRYRETFLFNIWRMGMNSIETGQPRYLDVTPKRIAALRSRGGRARQQAAAMPAVPVQLGSARSQICAIRAATSFPPTRPISHRAPSSSTRCSRTASRFSKATAAFPVAGKNYPAGSYVVKTAQAFRPHVLDMFEPQDHPNDFRYPGGPPVPPYDITGWTLAMQMGVQVRPHPGWL